MGILGGCENIKFSLQRLHVITDFYSSLQLLSLHKSGSEKRSLSFNQTVRKSSKILVFFLFLVEDIQCNSLWERFKTMHRNYIVRMLLDTGWA